MEDPVTQFRAWYSRLPMFTRSFLTSTFSTALLITFNLISTGTLHYNSNLTFKQLQIWRLVTSFICYGKLSLNFLFACYFAYYGISKVELELFDRKTYADFIFLVLYLWITILIGAAILDLYFLGDAFTFAMLYIWCKRKPFQMIKFFFGLQIKSGYFPLIFMGFNVLMGQSLLVFLLGLALGHLYIFIKDELTVRYRRDFLGTPLFLQCLLYSVLILFENIFLKKEENNKVLTEQQQVDIWFSFIYQGGKSYI